jgi:hypothetical protein
MVQEAEQRAWDAEQRARQAEQRASDADSRAGRLLALEDQLAMQKRLGDAVCAAGQGCVHEDDVRATVTSLMAIVLSVHAAQARADADRADQDSRRVCSNEQVVR